VATLKGVDSQRIGLDTQRCFAHAEKLLPALDEVRNKVMDVFKPYPPSTGADPDQMIYSGGFFTPKDRGLMNKICRAEPGQLARLAWSFKDSRLPEMLFRYRSRNYSDTLSPTESGQWEAQRLQRLKQPADARQLNPESFTREILAARQAREGDGPAQNILDQLESWGNEIMACRS